MPRITVTLPARTIALAKRLAKERKISVSELIFQAIAAMEQKKPLPRVAPITARLKGIVKFPSGKTDRQLIEEAMAEKHLKS